ncbi:MAG TPA: HAD family hydrolase [Anaerolineae bacterium]|nr:HAD family hydrolase [Anaerolineae bacterium]HOQ97499.1 HAD family hydrolase [Anaerolineae bacterium]HPL30685.1 HAD family hydrolase [Anaerolineae bacterium]
MAVKGVFFDAGGIFYRRPASKHKYVAGMLEAQGFVVELTGQERLREQWLRAQATRGQISPDQYWDECLLMHGVVAAAQRRAMIEQINEYSNHIEPIAGGREALAGLKQRGFILGIITDTMHPLERKMRWLGEVGVSEFIDVMACSTALGMRKPNPAIYLNAVQQARLTPSESAFVGHDTWELEGARKAGMATVAVHHDATAQADYYARSLVDLLNVPIFLASCA